MRVFPSSAWVIRFYRFLVWPFLFLLPPETAHRVAERTLGVRPIWRAYARFVKSPIIARTVAGIPMRNPVGLAAGFDKQCAYLESLGHFGFGYVIGGTVTYHQRFGNPKPRVRRLVRQQSMINALGFPSEGLEAAVARLRRLEVRPANVFVSIAALDEAETRDCLIALEPLVDAIEVNISSPNTAGLRRFQEPGALKGLLENLNQIRRKPLFIKIPPYLTDVDKESVMSLVRVCRDTGATGITASNTVPLQDSKMATGRGGLSGRSILPDMLRILPQVREEVGADMVVNACGGIASATDAQRALDAGADTVQLYTSLVYQGPALVKEILEGLAESSGVTVT